MLLRSTSTVLLTIALVSVAFLLLGPSSPAGTRFPPVSTRPSDVAGTPEAFGASSMDASAPLHLVYPALDIAAPVELLVAPSDGTPLPAPDGPRTVGWYPTLDDAAMHERGLLVGHVNWRDGTRGVFARLEEARAGDVFELQDGAERRVYRVTSTRQVEALNTTVDAILGAEDRDTVVLVTCSGPYLWDAGMYAHRTVVTAERIGPTDADRAPTLP